MDGGRLRDSAVVQGAENFQHLAPGGTWAAVGALVELQRPPELDLVVAVVALASGRIDLPAAFPFLAAVIAAAAFQGHRHALLAPFALPAIGQGAPVEIAFAGQRVLVAHWRLLGLIRT